MRIVNLVIFVVLVGAILTFAFQNLQSVSVTFLDFTISAPMAAVAVAVYVLGMLTGSSLIGMIRRSWEKSRMR